MRCLFQCLVLLVAMMEIANGSTLQTFGKWNVTENPSDGFYCDAVSFPGPFQGGAPVLVMPTISYESYPDIANEASVVMLKSVDQNGFTGCIMEPSEPSGKVSLNWFAFREDSLPNGVQTGTVDYHMFTSGISCQTVSFSRPLVRRPKILLSVRHSSTNTGRKDAMSVWAEDVTQQNFQVCLKEMTSFAGTHENFHVDWIALSDKFGTNMADLSSVLFNNNVQPSSENNYAYCKTVNFTQRYHEPPVVLVTANRLSTSVSGVHDSTVSWVKVVRRSYFDVCVKDLYGLANQHDPITVDYAAIGDLDPCINVTCDYFAVCRAFGPYDARCVCNDDCPTTEQNVCDSNGRSFDNLCLFQLDVCQTHVNYTYYHHGSCRVSEVQQLKVEAALPGISRMGTRNVLASRFPFSRGRQSVKEIPSWSNSHCQYVHFKPLSFYPDKPVHVQVSVSHVIPANNTTEVHDAAASWVEEISDTGFKFCVMESGRNEGPPHGFATVEWVAYQGAPRGGAAGVTAIDQWWTGTKCQTIDISEFGFQAVPTILVTAEHHRLGLKHDASTMWLEDVSQSSFRVCLRELQNFDGAHQDVYVNWLAFVELERPLFMEHGSVDFSQYSLPPMGNTSYAECQIVAFTGKYTTAPTVLVSPKHNSAGNLDPQYNDITAWIESITASGFQMCLKELSVNQQYDPVTVSYVVLKDICDPGWEYFDGFCYKRVDKCETWSNASSICMASNSDLVGIDNAEEDVFVQHLHRGRQSWIGLNDQANEGVYLWTDGGPVSFTNWGPGIPSPIDDDADCIHTSGRDNDYRWEAMSCDDCQNFTCKKDYDECTQGSYHCSDVNAGCVNTIGSYNCQCRFGFTGNGKTCTAVSFYAKFTNLGATGRLGPTTLGTFYVGQDHDNMVSLVNGIQYWTVPYTGTYQITTVGAAGGYDNSGSTNRGRGAYMRADFDLTKGEIVKILVGQHGVVNSGYTSSGGGGGTFVVMSNDVALIVAGGGGGIESLSTRLADCDAGTSTSGKSNTCDDSGCLRWSGGRNGGGGVQADTDGSGGGGGGFYSDGRSSTEFGGTYGYGGEGGKSFLNGGAGGRPKYSNAAGGFGGGGGAYGDGGGAGGGGGYSGGASGDNNWSSCGGGGGSYNSGKNQNNVEGYNGAGHGYVEIKRIIT